ncbi:FKBP12-associated protein [Myotisia sp. PD_48]|nr:FKBP12-associated protein [Myotisia sp. PD_48]
MASATPDPTSLTATPADIREVGAADTTTTHRPRNRGYRGSNRHARGRRGPPATRAEEAVEQHGPEQDSDSRLPVRGGRRGRGGRGSNNNHHRGRSEIVPMRSFGGRLTQQNEPTASQPGPRIPRNAEAHTALRPDASVFVPGQQQGSHRESNKNIRLPERLLPQSQPAAASASNPRPSPRHKLPKQTKTLIKSVADDLNTRIHEDIANNLYECPICTAEVGGKSKVWSCRLCWTVFHFHCIKRWSRNEGSGVTRPREQQEEAEAADQSYVRQWRCPGCNLPHDILPSVYTCWCEKEVDPHHLPGLPPHSCGQTCSTPRKKCPHPCDMVCHAGPCPSCQAMGPVQKCFCGKNETTRKCADTDYNNGWSCQQTCHGLLSCKEHQCKKTCHAGPCGECTELLAARCYCGKVSKNIMCSVKEDERLSSMSGETWTGSFNCGGECGRLYDCENHSCQKSCHPQGQQPLHCPFSPDVIKYCHCGKTPLSTMSKQESRKTCTDPIPHCEKICDQQLPCGHRCPDTCHDGPCRSCVVDIDIPCRCGRSSFRKICYEATAEPSTCARICKAALNCGRHACGEQCCSGERKSIERLATKRKLRSLNIIRQMEEEDIEPEHICTKICGRLLKCQLHRCEELCHKGSCRTCPNAIFDEVSCNCGRSILYPPLPCGTRPPPCSMPCTRPKACGHPPTRHDCHLDDESCPKCPFLTEKRCLCGKRVLKNQPCWLAEPRCGQVCGKELQCGAHSCTKTCHQPGDCEDATTACQQQCGKIKKQCSHICTEPCHAPFPCPEKSSCQAMIAVTCACGRLKKEKRCNASKDKDRSQPSPLPSLACDEECGRLKRNRTIATAFGLDLDPSILSNSTVPQPLSLDNLPYADDTIDLYLRLSSSSPLSSLETYESKLYHFATNIAEHTLRFQPVRSDLRSFIHAVAEDWGFRSESFDPEPHRHVVVFKSAGWLPPSLVGPSNAVHGLGIRGVSVGECAKFRERERGKERAAKREAAAERAKLQAATADSAKESGDGWAQVASRKRPGVGENASGSASYAKAGLLSSPHESKGMTGPSSGTKSGKLVLRSGVGIGRGIKSFGKPSRFGALGMVADPEDVAEDWEQEADKDEEPKKPETERNDDADGSSLIEGEEPVSA